MLRRTKSEALDLPPKVRSWLPVEVDGDAVRAQEARALDYLAQQPGAAGPTWVTFLGMLNQARHALAVAKAPAHARLRHRLRRRRPEGRRVHVVHRGRRDARAELGDSVRPPHRRRRRRATRAARRRRVPDRRRVRVLLGNLHAAGVGITLTAGTHVVFNDLDWVPANHWQAEDRIHRIGQTAPTFATYLVAAGTLDDFVAALLEQKAGTIGVLEAEAADRATLVDEVVESALARRDARRSRRRAASRATESVGLLEATSSTYSCSPGGASLRPSPMNV